MRIAITREVSTSLARCELSFLQRDAIDVDAARRQHQAYCDALQALGCTLQVLPALDDHPDAVFVEDVAIVLDEVAVITRPGARSRRGEVASVAAALLNDRPLLALREPATLDGGDVLRIGKDLWIGLSGRSNAAAVEQLQTLLGCHGYRVRGVEVRACLHLKSAITAVADDTVLVNPDWIDAAELARPDLRVIEVDASEAHAANALRIGDRLVYPTGFPRTAERLRATGLELALVDVSELQKAEGAVTCCSLVYRRGVD